MRLTRCGSQPGKTTEPPVWQGFRPRAQPVATSCKKRTAE